MNVSKLNGPERTAAIGGGILLLASFLPWYSYGGFGISGWDSGGLAVLGILSGLAGAGILIYAVLRDPEFRWGPFAASQLALIAVSVGAVLILLRLLTSIRNTSIGLYAGLFGAAMAAFGSLQTVRASGLDVPFVDRAAKEAE